MSGPPFQITPLPPFIPEDVEVYPELKSDTTIDTRRPVSYISVKIPSLTITKILALFINGVDAVKYLGAEVSEDGGKVLLDVPLYDTDVNVVMAFILSDGVDSIVTGHSWVGSATWDLGLPLRHLPYRDYGSLFQSGEVVLDNLPPLWRKHKDAAALSELLGSVVDSAYGQHIKAVLARNSSYVQWVEPVDRRRIAVLNFTGVAAEKVPYSDIVAAYDAADSYEKYGFMTDIFINSDGVPVFISDKQPGLEPTSAALHLPTATAVRPTEAYSKFTTLQVTSNSESTLFMESNSGVTGFDYCIIPPGTSVVPGQLPQSIYAEVQRTGERFKIYDKTATPGVMSGSVKFKSPIGFSASDGIHFYFMSGTPISDPCTIGVYCKKVVTLIAPDAHVKGGGLDRQFSNFIPVPIDSGTIYDKIRVAAGVNARVNKSKDALERYVAALIGIPMCPFPNGVVNSITDPDTKGVRGGQIDIWGAIQEYYRTPELTVEVDDTCEFLQVLVDQEIDGVEIVDFSSDPNFMVTRTYDADGALLTATLNTQCEDYVRSKAVGSVTIPDVADPTLASAEILESTSFMIRLGNYASELVSRAPELYSDIFACIDAVKPSGTDYWILLSDGSAVTKATAVNSDIDVSSKEGYESCYSDRALQEDAFVKGQFVAAYLGIAAGTPAVGDTISFTFSGGTNPGTVSTAITASDFAISNLYPADEAFRRIATAINANTATHKLVATYINGSKNTARKIRVVPQSGEFFTVNGWAPTVIGDASSNINLILSPTAATNIAVNRDPSRIFADLADALKLFNNYGEYNVVTYDKGSGDTAITVSDEGGGPFDGSTLEDIPLDTGTLTFKSDSIDVAANTKWGRIALRGVAALGGNVYGRYSVWANTSGGPIANGGTVTLTFSGISGMTTTAVSATKLADDESDLAFLVRLFALAAQDAEISRYLEFKYPVELGPAAIDGNSANRVEIIPKRWVPSASTQQLVALPPSSIAGLTIIATGTGSTAIRLNGVAATGGGFAYASYAAKSIDLRGAVTVGANTYYSNTVTMDFQDPSGGYHEFSLDIAFEPAVIAATPTQIAVVVTATATGSGSVTNEVLKTKFLEIVVNDYPEFSRDDDDWNVFGFSNDRGVAAAMKYANEPTWNANFFPKAVSLYPQNPLDFTALNISSVDATSRLVKEGEAILRDHIAELGEMGCYLDPGNTYPVVAGTYNVVQDIAANTDLGVVAATASAVKIDNRTGVDTPIRLYRRCTPATASCATTAALSGATYHADRAFLSSSAAALIVDDYAPGVGETVLVKDEATTTRNGIYYVFNQGSATAVWILTPIPVIARTTANLSSTYSGGDTLTASPAPFSALSIGGVYPQLGQGIWVDAQTAGAEDGFYVVTATGSTTAPWVLDRWTDALTNGTSPLITYGTTNASTRWICNDTTNRTFVAIPVELSYDVRPAGQSNYVFSRLGSNDFTVAGVNPTAITITATSSALGAPTGTIFGFVKPAEDSERYGGAHASTVAITDELTPAYWLSYRYNQYYPQTEITALVATTANITLSGPQTIDAVAVVAGNIVAVKNQASPSQNGVYVVQTLTWTRHVDANSAANCDRVAVHVTSGSVGAGLSFVMTEAGGNVTFTESETADVLTWIDDATKTQTFALDDDSFKLYENFEVT